MFDTLDTFRFKVEYEADMSEARGLTVAVNVILELPDFGSYLSLVLRTEALVETVTMCVDDTLGVAVTTLEFALVVLPTVLNATPMLLVIKLAE